MMSACADEHVKDKMTLSILLANLLGCAAGSEKKRSEMGTFLAKVNLVIMSQYIPWSACALQD